jgi:hypothetical protein
MAGDDDDDDPPDPATTETVDAANPRSVRRQRRRAEFREDQRGDFWRKVLADPVGRMVLWEVLADCGIHENRFECSPTGFPQPEATWFQLGRKDVGERIYRTLLRHDRLAVAAMHDEWDTQWQSQKARTPKKRDD